VASRNRSQEEADASGKCSRKFSRIAEYCCVCNHIEEAPLINAWRLRFRALRCRQSMAWRKQHSLAWYPCSPLAASNGAACRACQAWIKYRIEFAREKIFILAIENTFSFSIGLFLSKEMIRPLSQEFTFLHEISMRKNLSKALKKPWIS
jgi:hypothetical protein